jgi:copper chaperone
MKIMAESEHAVLNVPSISCNHCKRAIETAVAGLEGVQGVDVEVEEKSVSVEFDPDEISLTAIKDAIVEEGYPVAGEHTFGT